MVPEFLSRLGGVARSAFDQGRRLVLRRRGDQGTFPDTRASQAPRKGRRPHQPQEDPREEEIRPGIDVPYPGDYSGPLTLSYDPTDDDQADPGEVVWAWVPFEEDHSQGKDRPTLIIGIDGPWLLGLPLTSKNHELDRDQEASQGRHWHGIGGGPWDPRGKPSWARLDRVVRVDPATVRRVGGHLGRGTFKTIAMRIRDHWPANVAVRF